MYLYATTVARADAGDAARARSFASKYHLVKMISPPSNDRVGVACLSICPMQKHLVVGTLRGVVYGLQLSDYNKIGEKVEFSHDFHTVRTLCVCSIRHGRMRECGINHAIVCIYRLLGISGHVLPVGQTGLSTLLGVQCGARVSNGTASRDVGDLREYGHGAAAQRRDRYCAGNVFLCALCSVVTRMKGKCVLSRGYIFFYIFIAGYCKIRAIRRAAGIIAAARATAEPHVERWQCSSSE